MKLILVNLYSKVTMAHYLWSSYVLKAYLNKVFGDDKAVEIDILNYGVETETGKISQEIMERKPDWVGYSCYIWNIEKILGVVNDLKKRTDYTHIFGGPEITLPRISSLASSCTADYYVIGEGERKLARLIQFLNTEKPPPGSAVPKGVAYWKEGKIACNEDHEQAVELSEIPSVYLSGVLEKRLYARRQAFLETQRGCRFKCKYCVYHKSLPRISYFPLPRIFQELDHLIIESQIQALRIFDSIFTSDLERAKQIVRHLSDLQTRLEFLPWIYWEFTYRSVDEEFLKLVASLKTQAHILNTSNVIPVDRPQFFSEMLRGYTAVNCIGLQSFYKPALKAVGRAPINKESFDLFMKTIKKFNLVLKIDLILGLPFETTDTFFEGLDFFLPYLKGTDHVLNIHRLQILPGSELESLCCQYKIEYSVKAPHLVYSTNAQTRSELNYASKLTAVCFRIVNSPLRELFFEAHEKSGESFSRIFKTVFNAVNSSMEFKNTRLVQEDLIDDDYWSNDLFSEIPSKWLIDFLGNYHNRRRRS